MILKMKTLTFSIIVLVSIFLVPLSFAYGDMLEVQNMNIYTNKDSYGKGEFVQISGEMQSANGLTVSKDIPIIIVLTNNVLHKTTETLKTYPSPNGNFAIANISTANSSWESSGTYTVTASYGNITNTTTTFSFEMGDKNLLSPLEQSKLGVPLDKIECRSDLHPITKTEDNSIVCVTPQTTHTLVERGWATNAPESPIGIIGLNAEYTIGRPIHATINYAGYMNGGLYPDVKILNADNGSKVWVNCLYAHTEHAGGGGIGTATYNVQCGDKYPIINETGTYAMIASVDSAIAKTRFTVVKTPMPNEITDLENDCGQFYTVPENHTSLNTVPENHTSLNTVPVLLMKTNSTVCAKLTFTIISDYNDCNGPNCQHVLDVEPTGLINDLHYEKHGDSFSITPGKDYTNSFKIVTIPGTVDLANYPIGTNYTVTYIIRPLSNATGFYDQSIPRLVCERYPLAVGYAADKVNASDFSYIDTLNPPCGFGAYGLTKVEVSGMDYKYVTLRPAILEQEKQK